MKSLCRIPIHFFATLAVAAAASPADDGALESLAMTHQHVALETLARERLNRDPLDDTALWYWGVDAASEPRAREELLARAQACVHAKPKAARCHHLWGVLIAARLMEEIDLSALAAVGEVRRHFEEAVALAPDHYTMRRDLQAFYLEVPAVLGGSTRKARAQAEAFAPADAARAALLRAEVAISDKDFPSAESILAGVAQTEDPRFERDRLDVSVSLGNALIEAGAARRAQALFQRLSTLNPREPEPFIGLGKALTSLKQGLAAVNALERALQLDPRSHVHHLLARAAEAAGDKDKAMVSWRKVLAEPAEGMHADEAHTRLAALQR